MRGFGIGIIQGVPTQRKTMLRNPRRLSKQSIQFRVNITAQNLRNNRLFISRF